VKAGGEDQAGIEPTQERLLYSGREDDQHHEGVTVILRKVTEKCLMKWKLINSRLMRIRMKGKHINITIIQCYAPTNDSEEESKDAFYDQLEAELESTPRHEMNNNEERLLEFCTTDDVVIRGTLFPHQEIYKLIWCSPN